MPRFDDMLVYLKIADNLEKKRIKGSNKRAYGYMGFELYPNLIWYLVVISGSMSWHDTRYLFLSFFATDPKFEEADYAFFI